LRLWIIQKHTAHCPSNTTTRTVLHFGVATCLGGGPCSLFGIATGYELDRPRIESWLEARFYTPVQTGPGAHLASCTTGTGLFQGINSGRGVTLTPHPVYCRGQERVELYIYSPYGPYDLYRASVPVQYSYTSTPPMGRTTCTEPQCLHNGAINLYLYMSRPFSAIVGLSIQY